MISVSVKRKSNYNKVLNNIESSMPYAIEEVMKYAQNLALKNKGGRQNKTMIPYTVETQNKVVIGRLYTDFNWALFYEYGTGQYAEMPHIGKTAMFKYSNFYCWYAPADAVKKQYRDDEFIDINGEMFPMNAYMNGKKYVMVFQQKPHPFMRPTAFDLEDNATRIFANALREKLRK